MVNNRFPIKTCKELRHLFVEFKDYVRSGETGHVESNQSRSLNGAGAFVDFLCGIEPQKRTSYIDYPNKPWPE